MSEFGACIDATEPDVVTAETVLNSSFSICLNDSASSLRRRHVNSEISKDQENDLPGHGLGNIHQQNSNTSSQQQTPFSTTERPFAGRSSSSTDNNHDIDSIHRAVPAEALDNVIISSKNEATDRVPFEDAHFKGTEHLPRCETKESHLSV